MSEPHCTAPSGLRNNPRLSRWLRFEDDIVAVCSGKVEFGQGILTAMAQIAAGALDVPITRIRMIPASTPDSPDEGMTSGSRSLNEGGAALAWACAEARRRLHAAAAQRLGVPENSLRIECGRFIGPHGDTGLDYWGLPHASLLDVEADCDMPVATPHALQAVGAAVPRLDLPDKVSGCPRFVQDMSLPGMLHGRVVRPLAGDSALLAFDADAVRSLPGVVAVVRDGSFLAVVAEREEQAVQAREAAQRAARWAPVELPCNDEGVYDWLRAQPATSRVLVDQVDADARARGAQRLSARYTKPYLAHAALAPSCAVARATGDLMEVWTHSQGIFPLRQEIAAILRLPSDRVVVHHAEGAGCYGHNGADDAALDAVLTSRAVGGRPVRVQWMREDEFAWEPYGPAMVVDIDAVLDEQGGITEWQLQARSNGHLSRPGGATTANRQSSLIAAWHLADAAPRTPQADPPMGPDGISHGGVGRNAVTAIYDLPNQRVTTHCVDKMLLRASSLRAIGAYANVFAIESFMDELARLAGADPLAFRLRHLRDPRARAVLEQAAAAAGWQPGQAGDGQRGRGIACAQYSNHLGYFAAVVDVGIDPDLRVERVVAAVDVGCVINPDGLRNQVEGGIVQAISWTLKEQIHFGRDGLRSRHWEDYPILGFREVPAIEIHLQSRPSDPPLGAGEITMGPIAAAIANALAQVLEVRIRDLPITRDRIAAAF